VLYAPAAPEFFDKSLFRGFIANMREQKMIWLDENGKLDYDERLNEWEQDARLVLSRELRHTIHKISTDAIAAKPENGKSGV
jgi:glycerol-3-phosphate O-acyltransferase